MTKKLFFTRLALPINLIAFAYLLMTKSTNIALWLVYLVFIFSQVVYHVAKNENGNRWINVLLIAAGLTSIAAYLFFAS